MYQLLAHAEALHDEPVSFWHRYLTEPSVMNLLFVLGIVIIGWLLRNMFSVNPWQRTGIIGGYCLIASALSFHYNTILSLTSFSLAVLSLLGAIYFGLLVIPEPKRKDKK